MKSMFMIFVGASHEGHVECGRTYKIVGKTREAPFHTGGPHWYSYMFVDDAGNVESAASHLFVKPKPKFGRPRGVSP